MHTVGVFRSALEWKFAFFTVAIVICDGRKLKSSLLTFPLYQKYKRKKNHSQRWGGGGVLILWMKVKWFFQHSFWCFCSALEVKQNRLTRVEACAGNMSPRAGRKWTAVLRQWERPIQYRTFFFFLMVCGVSVWHSPSLHQHTCMDLDCRMPMLSRGRGNRHLWFGGSRFPGKICGNVM